MKVVKAGGLGLLVAMAISFVVTASLPVERYSKTVNAALTRATERATNRKPLLKDPAVNGFLHASMEPFWGRIPEGEGPVRDAIYGWSQTYSTQGRGQIVDHLAFVTARDPEYLKARAAFQALLPDLALAFSKQLFQPPNEDVNNPTVPLNNSAMVNLACGLNALAESLLAEGQAPKAALIYELVFRQGALVADDVSIVGLMRGVSLQGLAFQSLVGHLTPATKLTAEQWKGLSAGLAASTPTPNDMLTSLESDLYFGHAFLRLPRGSYEGDAKPLRGAYLVPGLRGRDQRVYNNRMGAAVESVQSRGLVSVASPPTGAAALLRGDTGPGTALLIPDYQRQSALLALHTAKLCGLTAFTAVCAYRAQNGSLPKSLAELDNLGLQAPGGVSWAQVKGMQYDVSNGKATVGVIVDPSLFALAGLNLEVEAEKILGGSAYFSLRMGGFVFEL